MLLVEKNVFRTGEATRLECEDMRHEATRPPVQGLVWTPLVEDFSFRRYLVALGQIHSSELYFPLGNANHVTLCAENKAGRGIWVRQTLSR